MKVLQLTSYDLSAGVHGGIIRAQEVRKLFEASGCDVKTLNIDPTSVECIEFDNPLPFIDDVRCLFADISKISVLKKLDSFELILLEQPWLVKLANFLLSENPKATLVYSSHNFESQLKNRILNGYEQSKVDEVLEIIDKAEKYLLANSKFVIYCSESDLVDYRNKLSESTPKVIFFPNSSRLNRARNGSECFAYPKSAEKSLVIAGSNYPPNIDGFCELMEGWQDWLLPGTCITVIGSLGVGLSKLFQATRPTFHSPGIEYLNQVSDQELFKSLDSASVILLPIKYGGGTNLKTADALYFGRQTIGSSIAFRGFEDAVLRENVTIAGDNFEMREAVTIALQNSNFEEDSRYQQEFTWDYWIESLENQLRGFLQND